MNRAAALVKTDKICHNLRIIRETSGTNIIGIVKANAYGVGMLEVAELLRSEAVNTLGVAFLHEAMQLRESGDDGEILIMAPPSINQVEKIVDLNLHTIVCNNLIVKELDSYAKSKGKVVKAHLFIDTGMNRDGIKPEEVDDFAEILNQYKNIDLVGVMTHFIGAENFDKAQTEKQVQLFKECVEKLQDSGFSFEYIHSHNSAAIFNGIENPGNYSRPGISMYGYLPDKSLMNGSQLEPAIELYSEVILTKEVHRGDSIGYSNRYIAENDIEIALVPVGYGHGLPWQLTNKGSFTVNGKKCPIRGSVCMDLTMIEITGMNVDIGDRVSIMGAGEADESIYDIADKAGTIPYDIITRLLPRVKRIYT